MGVRFLFSLCFIFSAWANPSVSISLADEKGNLIQEKTVLKVGQTIFFRMKSVQPESVESVILETWNRGVSHYEGITNTLSSENTFDIPYIIPNSAIHPTLAFDIVVRSKTGGRQHFFINKPADWKLKKNSFLESLVQLNKQLKVEGLSIDTRSPTIANVLSQKRAKGTMVSFDVQDSHPDLTKMRVADNPAKCTFLKGDLFRCQSFVEASDIIKSKKEIEILALDRARNLNKKKVENIYNPSSPIALRGPVLVQSCSLNSFDVKLAFQDGSSQMRKIPFYNLPDQRALASGSLEGYKKKLSSKYELHLKDKKLREFLYSLEPDASSLQSALQCEGQILKADLVQIKEIQE